MVDVKERISLVGGTGFLGMELASVLAAAGFSVDMLTRRPQRHRELGVIPNLKIVHCDAFDKKQLTAQLRNAGVVINLAGVLRQQQPYDFRKYHVYLSRQIIESARAAKVSRYLHLSALMAESSSASPFLRTRGEGENLVHNLSGASLEVTSFRPSIMFGAGDEFLSRMEKLLDQAPGVFPLSQPNAQIRPVFVGDVADVMLKSINDESSYGQRIDLQGPQAYTMRELVEYIASLGGRSARVVGLPKGLSSLELLLRGPVPGKAYLSNDNGRERNSDNGRKQMYCGTALESIAPLVVGHSTRH